MTTDKPNLTSEGMLTVKEAAVFAKVSRSTLFVWMRDEGLPFVRRGKGKKRTIPRQGLEAFLNANMHVNTPKLPDADSA